MILNTMKSCEKENGFVISEISSEVTPTKGHGTPVLQIEPMPNGLLKLNINAAYLANKTFDEANNVFLKSDLSVVNSLEEAVIHESGHARSINGLSSSKVKEIYEELEKIHFTGISNIALDDGAECLAELEVLRKRKIPVSPELAAFYKKYMGRKYL